MRNENSNRGPKIKATVKYTVTEMKNDCDAHIIHRLNTTEKRMSKLDVLLVETSKTKKQTNKQKKTENKMQNTITFKTRGKTAKGLTYTYGKMTKRKRKKNRRNS